MSLSRVSHFRLTSEVEFRDRTSEIRLIMFDKITSGRSWIVVSGEPAMGVDVCRGIGILRREREREGR